MSFTCGTTQMDFKNLLNSLPDVKYFYHILVISSPIYPFQFYRLRSPIIINLVNQRNKQRNFFLSKFKIFFQIFRHHRYHRSTFIYCSS